MTTQQIVALCLSTVAFLLSLVAGYYCLRIRHELQRSRALMARPSTWAFLRLLALPYADHPDYDASWRP